MKVDTTIEGTKIDLVSLSIEFIDPYIEMLNDPLVHATTDPGVELKNWTRKEVTDWLNEIIEKTNRFDFAIVKKNSKEFIGEVVLNEIKDNRASIRIAISSKFFDQGFGTEAMRLTIEFAFSQLNLEQIFLDVYDVNPRGIHVYKKIGFREISRFEEEEGLLEIKMLINK